MLRYLVSGLSYKFASGVFPIGTFVVNTVGSLIIGFLWVLFEQLNISAMIRVCVLVGVLGGFTTFSTFSMESFNLLRDGEIKMALINIVVTNLVGLVCVFVGFVTARWLLQFIR